MVKLPLLVRKGQRIWVWLDLPETHPLYWAQFVSKEYAVEAMRHMQRTRHYSIDDIMAEKIKKRHFTSFT